MALPGQRPELVCGEVRLGLPFLPQVSDATGQMDLTKVADCSPFAQELLMPDDCFVLDNGCCGKIYIWKGMWGSSSWGPGATPAQAGTPLLDQPG